MDSLTLGLIGADNSISYPVRGAGLADRKPLGALLLYAILGFFYAQVLSIMAGCAGTLERVCWFLMAGLLPRTTRHPFVSSERDGLFLLIGAIMCNHATNPSPEHSPKTRLVLTFDGDTLVSTQVIRDNQFVLSLDDFKALLQKDGFIDRPQCGNCQQFSSDFCKKGDFKVVHSGWCPNWVATEEWAEQHPELLAMIQGNGNA